jgi:hypothetical protein
VLCWKCQCNDAACRLNAFGDFECARWHVFVFVCVRVCVCVLVRGSGFLV